MMIDLAFQRALAGGFVCGTSAERLSFFLLWSMFLWPVSITALPLAGSETMTFIPPWQPSTMPPAVLDPSFDVRSYPNLTSVGHLQLHQIRPRALRRHLQTTYRDPRPRTEDIPGDTKTVRHRRRRRQQAEIGGRAGDSGSSKRGMEVENEGRSLGFTDGQERKQHHFELGLAQMARHAGSAQRLLPENSNGGTAAGTWRRDSELDDAEPDADTDTNTGSTQVQPTDEMQEPMTSPSPDMSSPDTPTPAAPARTPSGRRLPVFSETAAGLVQAEMTCVRNKYANAMKVLYGAPLAAVDVAVGYPQSGNGALGGQGQGDVASGRVILLPGETVVNPARPPAVPISPTILAPGREPMEKGIREGMPADQPQIPWGTWENPSSPGVDGSIQILDPSALPPRSTWADVLAGLRDWWRGAWQVSGIVQSPTNSCIRYLPHLDRGARQHLC